jgi:hypothetical protein
MVRFDLDPVLSRPHRVFFAGFESTTTRLQQAGWRLAAEENAYQERLTLVMKHWDLGLYMLADTLRVDFYAARRRGEPLAFHIRYVAEKLQAVRCTDVDFADFHAIDARPAFRLEEPKSIEDYRIFAAPLVRTEEIIVEPQSVAHCLDIIRKLQAPDLAAIRKRNAARENEAVNQTKFHAQIMTLAA